MHNLDLLYEEIGDEGIRNVVKVSKLLRKDHKNPEKVVKLLDLVDENNPYGLSFLERRYKWLKGEIAKLEMQMQGSRNYLQGLNNQISGAKYTLDYCHGTEQRTRLELQKLYEEKSKQESLLRESNGDIAE